jgi:hypothetical protein
MCKRVAFNRRRPCLGPPGRGRPRDRAGRSGALIRKARGHGAGWAVRRRGAHGDGAQRDGLVPPPRDLSTPDGRTGGGGDGTGTRRTSTSPCRGVTERPRRCLAAGVLPAGPLQRRPDPDGRRDRGKLSVGDEEQSMGVTRHTACAGGL